MPPPPLYATPYRCANQKFLGVADFVKMRSHFFLDWLIWFLWKLLLFCCRMIFTFVIMPIMVTSLYHIYAVCHSGMGAVGGILFSSCHGKPGIVWNMFLRLIILHRTQICDLTCSVWLISAAKSLWKRRFLLFVNFEDTYFFQILSREKIRKNW